MQQILTKFKLKPGALPRLKEYLSQFEKHRDECNESLKGEGVDLESFFLDGDYVYVFKKTENLSMTKAFQSASELPIYEVVKRMAAECFDSKEEFISVLEFSPN